jgi:hypothetical protein
MPGKVGNEGLEAGQLGKLGIFARLRRRAWRRHDGGCRVELFLNQLTAQDVLPVEIRRALELRKDRKMRGAVAHRRT